MEGLQARKAAYGSAGTQSKRSMFATTTLIIVFMCMKLLFFNPLTRGVIDYAIWTIALFQCFAYFISHSISRRTLQITSPFIALFLLQILGLVQDAGANALTIIASTICSWGILFSTFVSKDGIKKSVVEISFFAVVVFYFYKTVRGELLGNTIPGCLVFLIAIWIIMKQMSINTKSSRKSIFREILRCLFDITIILCTLYICLKSAARTELFSLLIMVLVYIAFSVFPKLLSKRFYYVLVLLVFGVTTLYISIRSFSWYNDVNMYSTMLFSKNIDSSRGYLWKASLQSLKSWQWLIGAGTSKLPSIARYAGSSFHNTFIQLVMQNGLLGLLFLLMLLKRVWDTLIVYADDKAVRMILAAFVGIVIFNSFETALFQNKAFLGIFQWIILGLGLNRCYRLSQKRDARSNDALLK